MKIGAVALAALALMMAGLLLYGVADVHFGAYLAVAGLLIAMGAIVAAHVWAWTHDEEDLG
jgi:hypothetical protein